MTPVGRPSPGRRLVPGDFGDPFRLARGTRLGPDRVVLAGLLAHSRGRRKGLVPTETCPPSVLDADGRHVRLSSRTTRISKTNCVVSLSRETSETTPSTLHLIPRGVSTGVGVGTLDADTVECPNVPERLLDLSKRTHKTHPGYSRGPGNLLPPSSRPPSPPLRWSLRLQPPYLPPSVLAPVETFDLLLSFT